MPKVPLKLKIWKKFNFSAVEVDQEKGWPSTRQLFSRLSAGSPFHHALWNVRFTYKHYLLLYPSCLECQRHISNLPCCPLLSINPLAFSPIWSCDVIHEYPYGLDEVNIIEIMSLNLCHYFLWFITLGFSTRNPFFY